MIKNLKMLIKKNVAVSVVILLALVIGVSATAYNSFDDKVIDRIADKYLEERESNENLGAITQDKSRFDHGIDILDKGLDVVGDVDITGTTTVRGKLYDGGAVTNASTTLTSARVLTATEVCEASIITVNSAATKATVAAASLDITLPATTTLFALCLAEEGAHTSFLFVNHSPIAASTTQIVTGTGIDLLEPDTGDAFAVEIAGAGGVAMIDIWRHTGASSTEPFDAYATVIQYSKAD